MWLRKKHKKIKTNISLSDEIMQKLKSCYVENTDVAGSYKSKAKQYLSTVFAYVNKIYSSIRIRICSLKNVNFTSISSWQKDYEKFTNEALSKFESECNKTYAGIAGRDEERVFRDIINSNNSFISRLASVISEQLNNNSYDPISENIFLVHGHGLEIRDYIDKRLKTMGYNPIILDREIKPGATVLEKFITYANRSSKAIIFMTPDDRIVEDSKEYCQARPNVFIELGYFLGIMDIKDIIIVKEEGARIPSDTGGVVYEQYLGNTKVLFQRIIKALNI